MKRLLLTILLTCAISLNANDLFALRIISSLPYTCTVPDETYYLSGNLTAVGNGIDIKAKNVFLDLTAGGTRQDTIFCNTGNGSYSYGISFWSSSFGAKVKGGAVVQAGTGNWFRGVQVGASGFNEIRDLNIVAQGTAGKCVLGEGGRGNVRFVGGKWKSNVMKYPSRCNNDAAVCFLYSGYGYVDTATFAYAVDSVEIENAPHVGIYIIGYTSGATKPQFARGNNVHCDARNFYWGTKGWDDTSHVDKTCHGGNAYAIMFSNPGPGSIMEGNTATPGTAYGGGRGFYCEGTYGAYGDSIAIRNNIFVGSEGPNQYNSSGLTYGIRVRWFSDYLSITGNQIFLTSDSDTSTHNVGKGATAMYLTANQEGDPSTDCWGHLILGRNWNITNNVISSIRADVGAEAHSYSVEMDGFEEYIDSVSWLIRVRPNNWTSLQGETLKVILGDTTNLIEGVDWTASASTYATTQSLHDALEALPNVRARYFGYAGATNLIQSICEGDATCDTTRTTGQLKLYMTGDNVVQGTYGQANCAIRLRMPFMFIPPSDHVIGNNWIKGNGDGVVLLGDYNDRCSGFQTTGDTIEYAGTVFGDTRTFRVGYYTASSIRNQFTDATFRNGASHSSIVFTNQSGADECDGLGQNIKFQQTLDVLVRGNNSLPVANAAVVAVNAYGQTPMNVQSGSDGHARKALTFWFDKYTLVAGCTGAGVDSFSFNPITITVTKGADQTVLSGYTLSPTNNKPIIVLSNTAGTGSNTPPVDPVNSFPCHECVVQAADLKAVLISWKTIDAENDALTYDFQVANDQGFQNIVASTTGVTPGPIFATWVTPALSENVVYWWRIRAFDGIDYSGWSSETSFTIDAPDPQFQNAGNHLIIRK